MSNQTSMKDFIANELDSDNFKAELAKVSVSCVPERFVAILKNYLASNAKSGDMMAALADENYGSLARKSLMRESLKCAADGLVPDGREASIQLTNVNVGTQADKRWAKVFQYMPMVSGITKTIYNTGLVLNISTGVIHENDKYEVDLGSKPFIKHNPSFSGRGDMVAAYASIQLKGSDTFTVDVMSKDEIMAIASRSKSKDRNGNLVGPWVTDPGEMWKKTVLRRLSKRIPKSDSKTEVLDRVLDGFDADFDISQPAEEQSGDFNAPEKVNEMPKGLQRVLGEQDEQQNEDIL